MAASTPLDPSWGAVTDSRFTYLGGGTPSRSLMGSRNRRAAARHPPTRPSRSLMGSRNSPGTTSPAPAAGPLDPSWGAVTGGSPPTPPCRAPSRSLMGSRNHGQHGHGGPARALSIPHGEP